VKIGLIGINRYAKFLNFACDLHVYAFQEYLVQNGHDVTILDYKPAYFYDFDMKHPADYAESKYRDAILRKASTPAQVAARAKDLEKWAELAVGYRSAYVERERRYDKFEAFIDKHLSFTAEVYDSDLLEIEDPGFDTYICVTDVIWQAIPRHTFDRGFLLGSKAFEGKQKISYAASRGASKDFSKDEAEVFFDYLEDIDAISVREADFGAYIEKNSPYAAPTVIDPVLLHGKEFWQAVSTKPKLERFVLLYYVMEEAADTIRKAVEYAKEHDLTLVELSDRPLKHGRVSDPDVKHIARYDVGMEEWLGYIEHAEAVFTNSFHGCCFAVLFEKPFFVGKRNGQKVPNFLATFDLSDRQFARDADVRTFSHDIDYAKVRGILEERRAQSGGFILDALTAAQQRIDAGETKDVAKFDQKRRSLRYPVRFHSGYTGETASLAGDQPKSLESKRLKAGALEYVDPSVRYVNDGTARIGENRFAIPGFQFAGWTMRFRIDNRWFWYLSDGTIAPGDIKGTDLDARKAVFADGATVPHLPVNNISSMVFIARWESGGELVSTPSTPAAEAPRAAAKPASARAAAAKPSLLRRVIRKAKRLLRRAS